MDFIKKIIEETILFEASKLEVIMILLESDRFLRYHSIGYAAKNL